MLPLTLLVGSTSEHLIESNLQDGRRCAFFSDGVQSYPEAVKQFIADKRLISLDKTRTDHFSPLYKKFFTMLGEEETDTKALLAASFGYLGEIDRVVIGDISITEAVLDFICLSYHAKGMVKSVDFIGLSQPILEKLKIGGFSRLSISEDCTGAPKTSLSSESDDYISLYAADAFSFLKKVSLRAAR